MLMLAKSSYFHNKINSTSNTQHFSLLCPPLSPILLFNCWWFYYYYQQSVLSSTNTYDPLCAIVPLDRRRPCVCCGGSYDIQHETRLHGKHIYTVWIVPYSLYSSLCALHHVENSKCLNKWTILVAASAFIYNVGGGTLQILDSIWLDRKSEAEWCHQNHSSILVEGRDYVL